MNTPNFNQNGPDQAQNNSSSTNNQQYKDLLDKYAQEIKNSSPLASTEPVSQPMETVNPKPVLTTPASPSILSENISVDEDLTPAPTTPILSTSSEAAPVATEDKIESPLPSRTEITPEPQTPAPASSTPSFNFSFDSVNKPNTNTPSFDTQNNTNSFNNSSDFSTPMTPSQPEHSTNLFKIIFFIALVIFLGVSGAIAYTIIRNPPTTATVDNSSDNVAQGVVCAGMNGKKYQEGDSFMASDGCNSCSCGADGNISCTEKTCAATSSTKSATPTSASSSASTVNATSYSNKQYQFSLQYPSNWTIIERKEGQSMALLSIYSPEFTKARNESKAADNTKIAGDRVYIETFASLDKLYNAPYIVGFKNKSATLEKLITDNSAVFTVPKKVTVGGLSGMQAYQKATSNNIVIILQKADGSLFMITFENNTTNKLSTAESLILNSMKFN